MSILRPIPPLLRAVLLLAVLLAVVLAFDVLPFLRGGEAFRWQWPHVPAPLGRVLAYAVALVLYLGGAFLLRRSQAGLLSWAFIAAFALPLLTTAVRHENPFHELYYRTVSPTATGPYFAAGRIDWAGAEWHDWPAVMEAYRDISRHVALSPPGLPLLHAAVNAGLRAVPPVAEALQRQFVPLQCHNYSLLEFDAAEWASALVGVLMPLWAALAVFPLYGIARRWIGNQAGWLALGWALVPALNLYAASWNTAYPLLALLAFWALLRGYDGGWGWFVVAGFLAFLLTFANISMVPLAALFGFYALLRQFLHERGSAPPWKPLAVGVAFAMGALLPWLLYTLLTGSSPLAMLQSAFDSHLELERPFVPWLWMHSWEWALLGGMPTVLLWLFGLRRAVQERDVLPLALLATLLLLLLSNTARGETGRVWLFFTPFALLSVSTLLRRWHAEGRRPALLWLSLYAAQALLLLALAATWNVMTAGDIRLRPAAPAPHEATLPQDATFEAGFRLVGWDAQQEGDQIVLRLNWESAQQMTTPYYFAALLVAPDGSTLPAQDWQPNETRYPTTCWLPGQTVSDTVRLDLPEEPQAGNWYISLTAFADVDNPMATVPVRLPDGSVDRQIGLGPVAVE